MSGSKGCRVDQYSPVHQEKTENATPDQDYDHIGRIEVVFKRCDRGPARTFEENDAPKDWDKSSVGPMHWEDKQAALISAVTTYVQ